MKKGFTLIEILTALSVFLVVVTVSSGSIMGIFDANRKSRSVKAVMLNFNLALESMSREIRFGKNYHCQENANANPSPSPRNCTAGGALMSFLSFEGNQITYRFLNGRIEKSVDEGTYFAVTSPEVVVSDASFRVVGATKGDQYQPKVLMHINGRAGDLAKGGTTFSLQTLISQRNLDKQ